MLILNHKRKKVASNMSQMMSFFWMDVKSLFDRFFKSKGLIHILYNSCIK